MAESPVYETKILHALHRIQHHHGYLKRDEMERFSTESEIPLYRLQEVASFFPHFRLAPPPALTLRVCRDMACHLAGAARVLREFGMLTNKYVRVEGVSCLGRCDRAPAACITLHKPAGENPEAPPLDATHEPEKETYLLGRSSTALKQVVHACFTEKGVRPNPDFDADHPNRDGEPRYPGPDWLIDPYKGRTPEYAAVKKAVAARRESLRQMGDALKAQYNWTEERAELFRVAADLRMIVDIPLDREMLEGFRSWQIKDGWADVLLKELDDAHADLRGMGGAGIPATQKWGDVRDAVRNLRKRREDDRAFIVVNGDESEPGTFKDRELLLHYPHLVIEGVILAGLITEASQGFIYIRHEYPEQIKACEDAIERAEALGVCGPKAVALGRPFPVSVFVSPGGYICGEQSALIEAMSDRRGEPRNLPPKLETNGLDDQPTLVSNVETFAWVPYIMVNGGQVYGALGMNGWRGRRYFSVSGDVNRPGVYEVPMGVTLRELIYSAQYCQGMVGNRNLKAFAPSGPSGGFLPAKLTAAAGLPKDHVNNKTWKELAARRGFDPNAADLDILDLELELNLFRALSPTQSLGAGLVIYAEGRDMADQAVNSIEFFRNESCGKCVPCRIGAQKLAALGTNLLNRKITPERWNDELLPIARDLGDVMVQSSICGLGRSVPIPLRTLVDFFGEDLAYHTSPNSPLGTRVSGIRETVVPKVQS